jgi:hypothetical protein
LKESDDIQWPLYVQQMRLEFLTKLCRDFNVSMERSILDLVLVIESKMEEEFKKEKLHNAKKSSEHPGE